MKKLKNSGFFFFIIWAALIISQGRQANAQSDIINPLAGYDNSNNFVVGRVVCVNSSNPSDTIPVTHGKIKLLKVSPPKIDVAVVDSAEINASGYYSLYGVPQGIFYIVAYPGDKVEDFMISFYPSGQLYATAYRVTFSNSQLRVCNIQTFSLNSTGGGSPISGEVADSINHNIKLRNSIITAKSGNEYIGYAITDNHGNYLISSLNPGNYTLIASRYGYKNKTQSIDVTQSAVPLDFYLSRDSSALISVSNSNTIIKNFKLFQNYPNPFNPSTEISFSLEKGMNVKLNIYTIEGKFIKELVNSFKPAGEYKFKFIAENLSSGIYNYVLETGSGQRESRLMVYTK